MIIDPGRSPACDAAAALVRRTALARLRGGSAGAVSGALAIAAHGWAAGGMPLHSSTLALLVAACTIVGALVAGLRPLRTTRLGLAAALVGGQLLGHTVMSIDMLDMPDSASMWGPAMLAAHIVAAFGGAATIQGTEAAYRLLTAAFSRVLPVLIQLPAIAGPPPLRIAHRNSVVQRILAADTYHTRGPPALAGI